jgi:hypothetical protein
MCLIYIIQIRKIVSENAESIIPDFEKNRIVREDEYQKLF